MHIDTFLARWRGAGGSERANYQLFIAGQNQNADHWLADDGANLGDLLRQSQAKAGAQRYDLTTRKLPAGRDTQQAEIDA